jgi:Zn-dependent metalloprotease
MKAWGGVRSLLVGVRTQLDRRPGLPLEATVHFGQGFVNAFWDGKRMVLGDGDNLLFKRFTSVDIIGKGSATQSCRT